MFFYIVALIAITYSQECTNLKSANSDGQCLQVNFEAGDVICQATCNSMAGTSVGQAGFENYVEGTCGDSFSTDCNVDESQTVEGCEFTVKGYAETSAKCSAANLMVALTLVVVAMMF